MASFFILAAHIAIASPLLPLAFSSFGGRGVGGGDLGESCVELAERSQEFFNNSIVQAVVVVVVVV